MKMKEGSKGIESHKGERRMSKGDCMNGEKIKSKEEKENSQEQANLIIWATNCFKTDLYSK